MVTDRLLLNNDMTEFFLIASRQQLTKVETLPLRVGTMEVEPVSSVRSRNLGAWFNTKLSMGIHISKVYSSGFYCLPNLRKIRKNLTQDFLLTLIHSFVTRRLDYCNSLLHGLPHYIKFQNYRDCKMLPLALLLTSVNTFK